MKSQMCHKDTLYLESLKCSTLEFSGDFYFPQGVAGHSQCVIHSNELIRMYWWYSCKWTASRLARTKPKAD